MNHKILELMIGRQADIECNDGILFTGIILYVDETSMAVKAKDGMFNYFCTEAISMAACKWDSELAKKWNDVLEAK